MGDVCFLGQPCDRMHNCQWCPCCKPCAPEKTAAWSAAALSWKLKLLVVRVVPSEEGPADVMQQVQQAQVCLSSLMSVSFVLSVRSQQSRITMQYVCTSLCSSCHSSSGHVLVSGSLAIRLLMCVQQHALGTHEKLTSLQDKRFGMALNI